MHKLKMIVVGDYGQQCFSEQASPVSLSIDLCDFSDTSPYKVFLQLEPMYSSTELAKKHHAFYNRILAWDETLLAACPNAVKFIFGTCRFGPHPIDEVDMAQKKFAVSFFTSNKTLYEGHRYRLEVFRKLPEQVGGIPVTKVQSPPWIPCKRPVLYPFQFSIIMENGRFPNYTTEKMVDCLISRTIPIYWGAPNVGEYLNKDGILAFESYPDLVHILENLTPEFYQSKLSAVEDNFHAGMKLANFYERVDDEIRRGLNGYNIRTS